MKTYKLLLKSNSSITKLPDAQTIFGTICNIIKQTQGEEMLIDFLNSFKFHKSLTQ